MVGKVAGTVHTCKGDILRTNLLILFIIQNQNAYIHYVSQNICIFCLTRECVSLNERINF